MLVTLALLWTAVHVQGPDTASRARFRAATQALGDSLTALEGAEATLQSDLVYTSSDLVLARATRLKARCSGALGGARHLDTMLGARAPLRRDLAALQTALKRCERDFTTEAVQPAVDSLRAWAPYRLAQLSATVRRYREAAHRAMRDAKVR